MIPFDNEIEQLLSQAEALLQDEKPVEALSILDRARRIRPRHGWMMLFRGMAFSQLGRLDEAVDEFIGAADGNVDDIDIQVDCARNLFLLEQHQDAVVCAQRAVELDAMDAGAQAILGDVLEHLGRIPEAVVAREAALALDPDDADNRMYLAISLCDLGSYEEAYEVAKPLFDEFPDEADIIRLHGACLSYLDRHEEAMVRWAELERVEGSSPLLLHNRASTLDALGRYEEALQAIDAAIAEEPEMSKAYFTRGLINEHNGNAVEAIDGYLMALASDPWFIDAVIHLTELAIAEHVEVLVMERITALLEQEPTSAELLFARGRLALQIGELDEARLALEDAVCREPALGIGWYTLAMVYGMMGYAEKAVVAADRALRDFPDEPALWLNRGLALQGTRQYVDALESLDRATELAPEWAMPWMHIGNILLVNLDRPADARGALKLALSLEQENDHARWMYGLCLLRLGKRDEATEIIDALLQTTPDHVRGRLVRAALRVQAGEKDAALEELEAIAAQGFPIRQFRGEPLFAPLLTDARFIALIASQTGKKDAPAS